MAGAVHVLDDDGNELPIGEAGTLWFEGPLGFEYRNDPGKTAEAVNALGYKTVGDMGYVDEEGYLYLTDRKAHMIISGGVNIYPQEAENVLVDHPKVFDVAVFGVPDDDLGEQVKAVVQPADWSDAGPELEAELIEYCRAQHRALQVPAHRRLRAGAPRLDTGKLYKGKLRVTGRVSRQRRGRTCSAAGSCRSRRPRTQPPTHWIVDSPGAATRRFPLVARPTPSDERSRLGPHREPRRRFAGIDVIACQPTPAPSRAELRSLRRTMPLSKRSQSK